MLKEEIEEIFAELESLNELLYERFVSRHDQYRETMSDELNRAVEARIYERYDYVSKRLWKEREEAREYAMFNLNERVELFVPRRSWFFGRKNRVAKLVVRELELESEERFRPAEEACEQREKALENGGGRKRKKKKAEKKGENSTTEEKGSGWVEYR